MDVGSLQVTYKDEYELAATVETKDESQEDNRKELSDLLCFNASIYDLMVQHSCLAMHGYGGQTGMVNLLVVIAFQAFNVYLQMTMLFEVHDLIMLPAMVRAQHLYHLFSDECYGTDSDFSFTSEVRENFENWHDHEKFELCQSPLTSPTFFFLILLIWTFFLAHELKQTMYFAWHILRLDSPLEGSVTFLDHDDSFVITRLSRSLKSWITITVFVPKVAIAVTLWIIGARWLTATTGFENLVLNALALTFICELDELIYRACIPEVTKSCLEKTKLPLPSFSYTPTYKAPLETVLTAFSCVALTLAYENVLQDAIPGYRGDLKELCRSAHMAHFSAHSHRR